MTATARPLFEVLDEHVAKVTAARAGKLTVADLDRMETDDRWLGFGYLGERRNFRQAIDSGEVGFPDTAAAELARMDADVLEEARIEGLSYDELFAWANSKDGRWFADCYGTPAAANYLPSRTRFARYGL